MMIKIKGLDWESKEDGKRGRLVTGDRHGSDKEEQGRNEVGNVLHVAQHR